MENRRIWEIDLFRTVAIILMIIFHTVFDLSDFLGMRINYFSGFWYWIGKISGWLFIFLSGISSGLSNRKTLIRGTKVLGIGMVITLVTYVLFGKYYIRFGILHFLGTCMILYPLLTKLNQWVLALLAVGIYLVNATVEQTIVNTGILIPLGFTYSGFVTFDYYPLIPYLAIFILGIIAYKLYYYQKQSLFKFTFDNKVIKWISQHSLWIYVIHQPIIVGVVFLLKFIVK